MRHNKKGRKLGTDYSHTKAMKRSLVSALFLILAHAHLLFLRFPFDSHSIGHHLSVS